MEVQGRSIPSHLVLEHGLCDTADHRSSIGRCQKRGPRGVEPLDRVADDPNDPVAIAHRAAVLREAWRPAINDRIEFLVDRCWDKRILDIGCVAHDAARMDSGQWLHGRLAAAAAHCIGVDVLEIGVAEMRRRGFVVELHDLREGLGPLAEHAPFDVIVAGELIEHVEALDMLFRTAAMALAAGGELIITTPNPYAPHRVRAAQRGIVWENVDHILHAFPSGVAELSERHGLTLAEAAVVQSSRRRRGAIDWAKSVRRRFHGRQWRTVGFATLGEARVRSVGHAPVPDLFESWWRWTGRRFLGETFVYVVRRRS